MGEAGSGLASKYQIIICPFEALLDLGFKELRCLRRVSSGTDFFRIHLHLQNVLASFGPWGYIPSSNGLCMAAMPKSCSVPVPPADVLEGTACFIEVFYPSICSFTLRTFCLTGDDQKYNPFMFQSLDIVEKL